MNDKNRTMAGEIIVDLQNHIVTLDGRIESLCEDIAKIHSTFKAIHYAMAEGIIRESEADSAISGVQAMLDVLKDNAEETLGVSNGFVHDTM